MRFGNELLYQPIGNTSGYGSLHISNESFRSMLELAEKNGCNTSNRFGSGPNWRMRVIRSACEVLNLNSDIILKHSFSRGLFGIPLANNFRSFLNGETEEASYRNIPLESLVSYWRNRWYATRRKNDIVVQKVRGFRPQQFLIEKTN